MTSKILSALVMGIVALGCQGGTPTAPAVVPEGVSPAGAGSETGALLSAQGGSSGCYAVSGEIRAEEQPDGGFAARIFGDIVGAYTADLTSTIFRGGSVHRRGTHIWNVTGGTVTPLIGEALTIDVELVAQTQMAPMIRISMKGQVVEGAKNGNLTFHGFFNPATTPPSTVADYRGVICP